MTVVVLSSALSGDLTHNKSFKLLICVWLCEQVTLQTIPNLPPGALPCLFPFPIQV